MTSSLDVILRRHIAIGHQWHRATKGYQLFWSTPASLHVHICLRLVSAPTGTKTTRAAQLILNDDHQLRFWSKPSTRLSSQRNIRDPIQRWGQIIEAASATRDCMPYKFQKQWVSSTLVVLSDACRSTFGAAYNETRRPMRRQLLWDRVMTGYSHWWGDIKMRMRLRLSAMVGTFTGWLETPVYGHRGPSLYTRKWNDADRCQSSIQNEDHQGDEYSLMTKLLNQMN